MIRTLTLLVLTLLVLPLCAQNYQFSGGFRAGLNFNALSGPLEMSMDGSETFERSRRTTGFHVGATFALEVTDLFGVKADLMYSQKGGEFAYGDPDNQIPSYFYVYSDDDRDGQIIFGQLNGEIDVINSYIDVPLTAYYRLGPLEIEGGVSAGLLVGSRVSGGLTYNTPRFGIDNEITFNLDGNYLNDETGFDGILEFSDEQIPGSNEFFPDLISAYYNSDRNDNLYKRLDFGLVVGLAYSLNSGLYVGVRYQHGLTDVSNGESDLRVSNENGVDERVFNTEDDDYTRSILASVGFRF